MTDHVLAPGKAGGRRSPSRKRTVAIDGFLTAGAVTPLHPSVDMDDMGESFGMDHNDRVGCCVMCGLKHALEAIFTMLGVEYTTWDDAKMLAFYQTQNPDFKTWDDAGTDADGGMDIQTALETLVKWGDIIAFGSVDYTNVDALEAAVYVGLAIPTGENLVQQNMSEQVWDAHPSAGVIGGHCTTWVAYDPKPRQVTWGEILGMTPAFVTHRVDEAWFVLTKAHLLNPTFRDGFDLEGFAAAVSALTKGKVIVPVTPPTPPPAPAPTPNTDGTFPGATAAVATRLALAADHSHITGDAWLNHHLETYFHLPHPQ